MDATETRTHGTDPRGRGPSGGKGGAGPEEGSQIYIGTPGGIVLCVEGGSGTELCGRFYHAYSEEAVPFANADQLIFAMESFYDSIGFPYPATIIRTFEGQGQPAESGKRGKKDTEAPGGTGRMPGFHKKEKRMKDQELLTKHGDLGSFIIRVQQRQNSSMQGRLTWVEKNKTLNFRSVWEMIRLIDSAIEMDNPVPEEEIPGWDA